MNTEKTELSFKVNSFRKIPNPYKTDGPNVPQSYVAICDVKNVPVELLDWMETNPRKQNIKSGVAKKIGNSLVRGTDFYLLNRGILVSAENCTFNNYDNTMTISFVDPEVHGDVDGGHTLKIILENRDQLENGQQFVRFEILTGVESIFEDLAEARNTSTQVKDTSIADLRDYFALIKDVVSDQKFANRINYVENDDGDIDISDLLSIFMLFNIDLYPDMSKHPTIAYSSKKKCVSTFTEYIKKVETNEISEQQNPYFKMKSIMIDIFKLYDQLEKKIGDYYKTKNPGGKYGATSGVTISKSGNGFTTKFYEDKMDYSSPNGFIYPILGAFRALVVEIDGVYKWKTDPFILMDQIGPDLVSTTIERSRSLGNNPQSVGKDTGNWQTLYMFVMVASMNNNLIK